LSADVAGRLVFLVNPASANGSLGRRWPEIAATAERLGIVGTTRLSERAGQLEELAREAALEGAERIVVVGGDGTLNEVVNGILGAGVERPPELGVVARGTGQDFVRTYGIPSDVAKALEIVRDGDVRTIDAGKATFRAEDGAERVRWFANMASAGLSGAVARRANHTSKALGGKTSFFVALVQVFARWRNVELEVDLDGERRNGRMTDVVVANGQYHGGAMWLAPEAKQDDGLFDALVIGDITKGDFILNVARIYRGTHLSHPKIELVRAARVRVDSKHPLPIEVDGEQPGTTPVTFEVVPAALRVRVPPAQ
jgi:YegS/Rv2252/BmrU family lipid kinase